MNNLSLTGIGITDEKLTLLKELAQTSDYWSIALALVNAASCLKLTSLSSHNRRRLTSLVLELDNALYNKSWGANIQEPFTERQTELTYSSFDKMRLLLKRNSHGIT